MAAETKYGHNDGVYQERVYHLSVACAQEAAKQGVKRFIEVSTAQVTFSLSKVKCQEYASKYNQLSQVYDPSEKPKSEDGKLGPWTNLAKFKLQVEDELKNIAGLNYVIVRPAIIYGPGDRTGIGVFSLSSLVFFVALPFF